MTAAQHSARIVLLRSGLFHFMREVAEERDEHRRAESGLSSGGCASGHFRGRRRANLADSWKRVIMELAAHSQNSRISTIDAIGQKAAVTGGVFGDRSLSLMRQLQTFGPGVSSAPLMQCRRLDNAAFPQNTLGTASATGIFPAADLSVFDALVGQPGPKATL